ncbi:MAG: stage III sporulation protein D [Ruminococcaceae bacterium]|nr:stage III sporulation protein D [Oscillospiraceae bacterium]
MNYKKSRPRCRLLGEYIVENEATVRSAATYFGVSKSTVHKDVTEHLKRSDPLLFEKVNEILQKHKEERHLRGGEATRQKYLERRTERGGVISLP